MMTAINALEAASDCAESTMVYLDQLSVKLVNKPLFEDGMFVIEKNGDVRYTEEAQDKFNELYAHYLEILT